MPSPPAGGKPSGLRVKKKPGWGSQGRSRLSEQRNEQLVMQRAIQESTVDGNLSSSLVTKACSSHFTGLGLVYLGLQLFRDILLVLPR